MWTSPFLPKDFIFSHLESIRKYYILTFRSLQYSIRSAGDMLGKSDVTVVVSIRNPLKHIL